MLELQIISLNVGEPAEYAYEGRQVASGIVKQPVKNPLRLGRINFAGDRQADLENHGGPDKAVNVYPFDHYPYWRNKLQLALPPGSFGENLTLQGAVETEICIGDQFAFGEAVLQVTQPRQPCYKLAMRHKVPDLAALVVQTGYTGFYMRVLQEAVVDPSGSLKRIGREPVLMTIAEANAVMNDKALQNPDALRRLLSIPSLSASWRETLQKRLGE